MRRAGAALLALAVAHAPAAAACLKAETDSQVAEGRVVAGRFSDFAGRTERAFLLQLAAPACLTGEDEFDKVERTDRIHIYSTDEALQRRIGTFVGKKVRVTGSPFGEHTAHHHAPIVMNITTIEAAR